jgi:hypothetical protein
MAQRRRETRHLTMRDLPFVRPALGRRRRTWRSPFIAVRGRPTARFPVTGSSRCWGTCTILERGWIRLGTHLPATRPDGGLCSVDAANVSGGPREVSHSLPGLPTPAAVFVTAALQGVRDARRVRRNGRGPPAARNSSGAPGSGLVRRASRAAPDWAEPRAPQARSSPSSRGDVACTFEPRPTQTKAPSGGANRTRSPDVRRVRPDFQAG